MTEEQKMAMVDKIVEEILTREKKLNLGGAITLFVSVARTYDSSLGFEPESPEDIVITEMVNDRLREYNETLKDEEQHRKI